MRWALLRTDGEYLYCAHVTVPIGNTLPHMSYTHEQESHPLTVPRRMMSLNDLPPTPHNAYVKLFASREREQEAAFAALDAPPVAVEPRLQACVVGLQQALGVKGEFEPQGIPQFPSGCIRDFCTELWAARLQYDHRQKCLCHLLSITWPCLISK